MNTKIIIYIKGGCLVDVATNGNTEVYLQDLDNHDEAPARVPTEELTNEAFEKRLPRYNE